jgi:hypothetical protein
MTDEKPIPLKAVVEQVVAQLNAPITLAEFAQRVQAIRPSKAKRPLAILHNHLRWQTGKTIVFLDRQTIVPLRLALPGVRFRLRLTRLEVEQGVLVAQPAFEHFLRRDIALQDAQLVDADERALPVRPMVLTVEAKNLFGPSTLDLPALDLGDWFRAQQIQAGDSILVTIEDWEKGRFRLEHEPASQRRQAEIERQNQELANLLFDLLEADHREQLYAYHAIPTAYARLSDARGYPGDHWAQVIARDARMQWDGFHINYREEFHSLMEEMLFWGQEEEAQPEETYTPAQAQQVYRFKAALAHRPGLWRQIEIQGQQTLAGFDAILRDAFNHDPSDHLGGFWRRIRRGKSQRFREVDLAEIDPLGEGDGADLPLAELALQPGDELKYVYDFGDWIEHQITLEAIVAPEAGAEYPRIVGQSQPRHRYCQSCKAEGRKTIATWICIDCSEEQQREVLLCEDCLEGKHEDHYAEELLY